MSFFELLILSSALSVDSFGAGLVYGLRKIRVPWTAMGIVAGTSALATGASVWVGRWAGVLIGAGRAAVLGGVVLTCMGLWIILEGLRDGVREAAARSGRDLIATLRIKPVGVVVQVMRDPENADVDRSGAIGAGEAGLLGLALALDSIGTGLGAGMRGASWLLAGVEVGLISHACITVGVFLGRRVPEGWGGMWLKVAPGIILTFMGISSLV